MSSRPSTHSEIEQYKKAAREKLPSVEVVTADGDYAYVNEEPKATRIANPTCDTLRKCSAHKIALNECAECWPGFLNFLGMSAGNFHFASGAAKRAKEELRLQERAKAEEELEKEKEQA